MRPLSLAVLFGLLLLLPTTALATEPILDLLDQPVPILPDGSDATAADIQAAIIRGCARRGWTASRDEDGKLVASILVRGRHYAEVSITFTARAYSIQYRASRDLDFNEKRRRIHGNYNRWVAKLAQTINRELISPTRPI